MAKIQKGEVRNPYGRAGRPRADGETRSDGWKNMLSGIGTDRDPIEHSRPQNDSRLEREYVDAIYRADGIGRRVVDLPAEEMTRQWVQIQGDDADDRLVGLDRLNAKQKFNKALRWAGLYGGSVIVMLIDDGEGDLSTPLNENRVRGVNDLIVYDRHQTSWNIADVNSDPQSRWFGRVERMMISPVNGVPYRVHRSRTLIFDGEDVPDRLRSRNDGWGDSRLQPVFRSLSRYGEAMGGTSAIIRDFILPVLSMKNLSDLIASGQEDVVKKRLEILGVSRSVLNVLLIDADDEGYEKKASSVSGIDKLLQELKHNLSACTGIPQTKLFGRAPEGMNSTGEGDFRQWYDTVRGEQEDNMMPNLSVLVRLIDLANGGQPDDRMIVPNPLWQPTEGEKATTLKTTVEALTLGIDYAIISPEAAEMMLAQQGIQNG